jgi:hypothetical protein
MTRVNRAIDRKRAELRDQIKMTPRQYYSWTENNYGEFFFVPPERAGPTIAVTPLPGPVVPKDVGPPSATQTANVDPVRPPPVSESPPAQVPPPLRNIASIPPPASGGISASTRRSRFTIRTATEARGTPLGPWFTIPTVDACEQVCTETAGCNVFTYTSARRQCYVYERAELVSNTLFESGFHDASAVSEPFTIRTATEARGTPLGPWFTVPTADGCEHVCRQTAGCNVFTYTSARRQCYVYERAELVPNTVFESGFRDPSALSK